MLLGLPLAPAGAMRGRRLQGFPARLAKCLSVGKGVRPVWTKAFQDREFMWLCLPGQMFPGGGQ